MIPVSKYKPNKHTPSKKTKLKSASYGKSNKRSPIDLINIIPYQISRLISLNPSQIHARIHTHMHVQNRIKISLTNLLKQGEISNFLHKIINF
jgi:hypothetical protein